MTQAMLAAAIGVHVPNISQMERGVAAHWQGNG